MPTHQPQNDDEKPLRLNQDDLEWIREARKQDAHERWLRGQIKVLWPWIIAGISALVAALTWIKDHVRL